MGLLQDGDYYDKATLVPCTPIIQRRLGFNDDEGSDTGTHIGGDVVGSTSPAKNYGKSGTPRLERLLQSEGTYDRTIISWFGDVYMLNITALLSNKRERKHHSSSLPGLGAIVQPQVVRI